MWLWLLSGGAMAGEGSSYLGRAADAGSGVLRVEYECMCIIVLPPAEAPSGWPDASDDGGGSGTARLSDCDGKRVESASTPPVPAGGGGGGGGCEEEEDEEQEDELEAGLEVEAEG